MADICIGSRSGEHVAIEVRSYEHPEANDRDDGNWLVSRVSVRAGAWSGIGTASLRAEDFVDFLRQIRILLQNPTAQAIFTTMEGQLEFRLSGDRLGHVTVEGEALDQPGVGNRLCFRFEVDQSYLPALISALEEIITDYPVREY